MRDGPGGRETALASLIVFAVAGLVVAAAVLGASVAGVGGGPTRSAETDASTDGPPPEYAPGVVVAEPIPANGTVALNRSLRARGDPKTVVVERGDRVPPERIRQLVRAIVLAGHEVRLRTETPPEEITAGPPPLSEDLADADAYVRIDPPAPLNAAEIEAVRTLTDRGGHLVLLAEPSRRRVRAGTFGASIETIRTRSVPLAAAYGIVFGTRYLHDTTNNDGNFRNVLVGPTRAGNAPDIGRAVLYTATPVSVRGDARDTAVVARTVPTTNLSGGGRACRYPVAVRTGNALAVGDTTFLAEGRHNVADNERLIAYVAAFAVRGDRTVLDEELLAPDAGTDEDADDTEGTTGTATPTPDRVTDGC